MKKRGILFLLAAIFIAALAYLKFQKGQISFNEVFMFPATLISICVFFVLIDFFSYFKIKHSLPPVPETGHYNRVDSPLAKALPFTVVEKDGKFFRADGTIAIIEGNLVRVFRI